MRILICVLCCVLIAGLAATPVRGGESPLLRINGAVNHPLAIDATDPAPFRTMDVQRNEIKAGSEYDGSFFYRGIPLRDLLELARIEKKDTDFKKQVDLAVFVRNQAGSTVALSWGEIFYRNPQNVVIAFSAEPILPHKGVKHFADPEAYHQLMKTLNREIGFPKLVVTGDFHTDRCIEKITEITVADLRLSVPGKKTPKPFSDRFSVAGSVKTGGVYESLPDLPTVSVPFHIVGEGRGYHGSHIFRGIPVTELIGKADPEMGLDTVFAISSTDGYRAVLSYGELFLNSYGDRFIIADTCDDVPIAENGRFIFVAPDDLMADRMVKAVFQIEVIKPAAVKEPL